MLVTFNGAQARSFKQGKQIRMAKLADDADVTVRYLSDLEHGKKRNPSAVCVYRISRALDVPMEKLMQVLPDDDE